MFLYHRYPDLIAGRAEAADLVVFVIWFALLLAPLFKEISLFGITLKREIEGLKGFVAAQITDIRSEVRNAVDVRTTFSPHLILPAPAADAQLPELEARIRSAVSDAFASHGVEAPKQQARLAVSDDVALLFATRYNIEKELKRIGDRRQLLDHTKRPVPAFRLAHLLAQAQLIEPRLLSAIREVYAVCSPAIHGEPLTEAQVSFVKDIGPELVAALRAIS